MTEYVWVETIAERWGVSKSWVYKLCRDGRVNGAFLSEGRWSIPENAEKPGDYRIHKRYIKALSGNKKLSLPALMPLKLKGESDRIPDNAERVISESADYIIDLVDVHPGSGKILFCTLVNEHIKASVLCENYAQYSYFSSLKESPDELYRLLSIMSFEYSILTPDRRKAYFNEKKTAYNKRESKNDCENAALLLFVSSSNPHCAIELDSEGNILSEYKKNAIPAQIEKEDLLILSSILSRACIYRKEEKERMSFSEYSALHLSKEQYEQREFEDIEKKVERLIII